MPITKAEAQGVTRAFVRDYPGALELAYKFREDAAELYGPRAAEVPADMKGGYVPKETMHAGRAYRGRVDVPLQNVESAGDLLMTSHQSVYAVLDLSSQFAGAITRAKLIETLRAQGEDARVVDAMTPANEIPTGHSDQTLADIWDIMMKSSSRIVAIIDDRLFRGLVTLDDLGEVVHLVTTTGRYSQPTTVTAPPAGLPGSMDRSG